MNGCDIEMDVNLGELDVRWEGSGELMVMQVLNYISQSSPPVQSLSGLRDGQCLIKLISSFEKHTQWQSPKVINLFFNFKNDVITGYQFIDGWLDCYYNTGHVIVTDSFRFAVDNHVMAIALLVLNVLYVKRDSLTYDLKIRLEALWIDFSSTVDSIILWMRTRAQLNDRNTGLHSCAHQLFSNHSLQEYQSIQQRLTQMVQQKLINDQMKRLDEKDVLLRQQAIELSELGTKMFAIIKEMNETKKMNSNLSTEVKWQMSANKELNQTVAKLEHENQVLKQLALKNSSFFKAIIDQSNTSGQHISTDECDAINGPNGVDVINEIDMNRLSMSESPKEANGVASERNEDTDSSTEIEDITDSGNHSDAATDDLLLDILSKESNNDNKVNDIKDSILMPNTWQQYFANECNNTNGLDDSTDKEEEEDQSVRYSDTYN